MRSDDGGVKHSRGAALHFKRHAAWTGGAPDEHLQSYGYSLRGEQHLPSAVGPAWNPPDIVALR